MINFGASKLVIGNGFDLYCGLKSSYKDFFNYNEEIKEWCNDFMSLKCVEFNANVLGLDKSRLINHIKYDKISKNNNVTFWNLYFHIINSNYNRDWCVIEKELQYAITDSNSLIYDALKIIEDYILNGDTKIEFENKAYLLAKYFIFDNGKIGRIDANSYSNYLLSELKKYEIRFGNYIYEQSKNNYKFIDNVRKFLKKIAKVTNWLSIDSFNYTPMSSILEKIYDESYCVRHINGDYNEPIFGIDSSNIKITSNNYMFTKTYRRLEQMLDDKTKENYMYVDNEFFSLVIFGHSLNEQDYNYFFPILDSLNLYDTDNNRKIIVLYSVYEKNNEYEIKTNLINAISKMLDIYEDYNGKTREKRLLDKLIMQGRLYVLNVETLSSL